MNRTSYFNYIEEKLSLLSMRVKNRGKLNILDFHLHSENFYMELLNLIYGYNLKNLNSIDQNVEGIDLIDHTNKIVAQVSSTSTKQKIEETLKKDIFKQYNSYKFIFISISNPADNLRKGKFKNPHGISFNLSHDIYDIPSILRTIISLDIGKQNKLYKFIEKELGDEVNLMKVDSDLALIINILANENLNQLNENVNINSFEIQRKITHNNLEEASLTIEDYKVFHARLNTKYKKFDEEGSNKSIFVLQTIRSQYINICRKYKQEDNDTKFFETIEAIKEIIKNSRNYVELTFEALEVCANIIVVDAFIRCKIFKNPEGYNYVIA